MDVIIRPIQKEDHKTVYNFQCSYLDKESYESFILRINLNPELYLVALVKNEIVGICYGNPLERDKSVMNLQGIAVYLDSNKYFGRMGIGSKMIKSFEKVTLKKGYKVLGLGSAEDVKVEKFYLKNNFQPIELVVKDNKYNELKRVPVNSYIEGINIKKKLYSEYNPGEIIFIYQKILE